jgi:histone deacetylase 6
MAFEQLEAEARLYNSIYLCPESAFCGRLSCGGVIEMCNAVWTGVVRNGICVVRPPGHHAEGDKAMYVVVIFSGAI